MDPRGCANALGVFLGELYRQNRVRQGRADGDDPVDPGLSGPVQHVIHLVEQLRKRQMSVGVDQPHRTGSVSKVFRPRGSLRPSRAVHILEMLDLWRTPRRPNDGHQIKPARAITRGPFHEEITGGTLDLGPLRLADRIHQILGFFSRSGLDLNEDDGIAVGGNQIDLSDGSTIITGDDAMMIAFQVPRRRPLAT